MSNLKGTNSPLLTSSRVKPVIFPLSGALLAITLNIAPFNHKPAIAQANTDERTVVMCETDSTAVRVYEKAGELFMRAFSRTQNNLWMNNTPTEMQSLAEGTEYRNLSGEQTTTVSVTNATTDDCTIMIDDQPVESGRILERDAPPVSTESTEPESTDPETDIETTDPTPTTPDPDTPDPDTPDPNTPEAALPTEIKAAVKAALAEEIGSTITTVRSYSQQTWSDGCLGLGGPAESCLAALTEGWQVELMDLATGDRYTYRTNQEGSSVRLDENASL